MKKLGQITSAALVASSLVAPEASAEKKDLHSYYQKIQERVNGQVCELKVKGDGEGKHVHAKINLGEKDEGITLSTEHGPGTKNFAGQKHEWKDQDGNMIPETVEATYPDGRKETVDIQSEENPDATLSTRRAISLKRLYKNLMLSVTRRCEQPTEKTPTE